MQSAECRVQGAECRVQGAECRVQGAECRVQGAECRVQSAGCRVQGAGCRFENEYKRKTVLFSQNGSYIELSAHQEGGSIHSFFAFELKLDNFDRAFAAGDCQG